jgi:hypothetical protein
MALWLLATSISLLILVARHQRKRRHAVEQAVD